MNRERGKEKRGGVLITGIGKGREVYIYLCASWLISGRGENAATTNL